MDGVVRVAGVGAQIELGGKTFTVRGRTIGFYSAVEAEILKLRDNPMDLIVKAASNGDITQLENMARVVADKFRNWRMATYADYSQFMSTPRGDALQVWLAIRKDTPDVELEWVHHKMLELLVGSDGMDKREAIFKAIEVASGEDSLGNSTGPSS